MNSHSQTQSVLIVHNPNHTLHGPPQHISHPEKPDRLTQVINRLENEGLFKQCTLITEFPPAPEHITTTHSSSYIDFVKGLPEKYEGDTYHNPNTHKVAEAGASGICFAVDKILKDEYNYAFCLIRPPGHHANMVEDNLTGFCVYNNVAIATNYAMQQYKVKKVLIFDWDVHHGDSTQKIFYDNPDVLFISIHKYLQGHFYPGATGSLSNVGADKGKGFNINCPWDITEEAGCVRTVGDNEYVYIMEAVLMPIITSFQPDLIFVSAGFDSANGDPLGGLSVSPFCYSYILTKLLSFQKKVIVTLEGGYNPAVNSVCAEYCVRTLLGESLPVNNGSEKWNPNYMKERCLPNKIALDLAERIALTHKKYWPVLQEGSYPSFRDQIKKNIEKYKSEDLWFTSSPSSIIIKNQLWKDFKLDEYIFLKLALDEKSFLYESLRPLQEYLPVQITQRKKEDLNLVKYDLGLDNYGELSYFIYKVGCKDLKGDTPIYLNKNSRISKVIVRDSNNNIVEKFDENVNYGLNYDMKIDDYDHDRFIFFIRFFLESHEKARPNHKAFFYFRDFIGKLKEWLEKKSRVNFSSFSFGFFLDNNRGWYKACLLDFDDLTISEIECEDPKDRLVYKVIEEMKETLQNDEEFVFEEV